MENNTVTPGKMQPISQNEINLPKGGGAMRSIGGAYNANLFNGTGAYSIPLPVTPARGFEPELSLDYNSGDGNSEFGLGFSVSLPRISVNTEKRIPRYDGLDGFTMSDQGPLVLKKSTTDNPNPQTINLNGDNYEVSTYLPRLEGAFSRIERWKNEATGEVHWKVTSKANVSSYFGRNNTSRIFNPANPLQVYEWLIDEAIDPKGNRIVYSYKEENNDNVPKDVFEVNRSFTAQRYLHSISYGNYLKKDATEESFAFNIVFDYGEYDISNPLVAWTPVKEWDCRPDPFSSYRSGFEIRTFRLCRNILLFHCFKEELGAPFLVKASTLEHINEETHDPIRFLGMSKVKKAGLCAFRKASESTFERSDFPALEFSWSEFNPPERPEFKTLTSGGYDIPGLLESAQFFPVDLNGEGIPGLLYTDGSSVMYLEPEGDGKYKRPENLAQFPINRNLGDGTAAIRDVDGNGGIELVVADEHKAGFYELQNNNSWQNFQPFESYPTNYANPYIETADLSSNGKTDLLIIGTEHISIYESLGEKGYQSLKTVDNLNNVPMNSLDNPVEYVGFANIFGDGVSHRISVRNRSVQCWPSFGYGNFDEVVTLGNPPDFGEDFKATNVFFTDLDGSGTADLVYVYPDRLEAYLNQSGNSFSDRIVIYLPALFSAIDQINFADILGNGTSSIIFTKISPTPVQYWYNFAGETAAENGKWVASIKPYLLSEIDNHSGSTTTIKYGTSSHYALEDKLKGRPWPTTVPFPVQVVNEVNTYDHISEISSVTRYAWHDGYYDPINKAFRGFGYVESWDAENETVDQKSPASVPPVYTRTWYLTGAYADYDALLQQYKTSYFDGDKDALAFPDSFFDPAIYLHNPETISQAYVALRDRMIRQEVYGLDDSPEAKYPYTVQQSNYTVVLIQAAETNARGVFRIDSRENIQYNYERNPADPNIRQQFTLEVDPQCGEVTKDCSIFLGRRTTGQAQLSIYPEQQLLKASANTKSFINTSKEQEYWYRGMLYDEQEFELFRLDTAGTQYFSYTEISRQAAQAFANVVPYMGSPKAENTDPYAAQLSWNTAYFWNEAQSEALAGGEISSRALLHHQARQVYTKENINQIYGDRLSEAIILEQGGYFYNDTRGYYENRGLVQHYFKDANSFFMPWQVENSFVSPASELYRKSTLEYDLYFLAAIKSTQYLDEQTEQVITAKIDYQAMLPKQIVDINNNVRQVFYDPFGKVIVSTLFGHEEGKPCGNMRLYEYDSQPAEYIRRDKAENGDPITFEDVIYNSEYYLQGAGSFFFYDLHAYERSVILHQEKSAQPQPLSSVSLERYDYYHLDGNTTAFRCHTELEFSSGEGKIIEKKMRVEPGLAVTRNDKGLLKRSKGNILLAETETRWLVSGRTVYNNKGLPAEQYLAYFSNTPNYESQKEITGEGIVPPPATLFYDPLLRQIRQDTPKGFFTKVVYTAWEESHFDEDDTVLDAPYYKWFIANYPAEPTQEQKDEKDALDKAALFYNTPTIYVTDQTASRIREIQTAEGGKQMVTLLEYDIQSRKVLLTDPRLFKSNMEKGTDYYSFKYLYPMGSKSYDSSNSADAGLERFFNNIFEGLCWSISPRNYCQLLNYDRLDRKSKLNIMLIEYSGPVINYGDFNLVEAFTYGETQADADKANLRGRLYELKDLSGITTTLQYSMAGNVLKSARQVVKDYKTPANWKNTVELEPEIYQLSFTFDARGTLLSETTPDGSVTSFSYNIAGLLDSISLNGQDNFTQEIVSKIEYDANRQRKKIRYANGIQTSYTYEWTTQRLVRLLSTRQQTDQQIVQDISYTYDPVGNLTRSWDRSIETIFYKNQQVDPMSDYTYDAYYRLTIASGRQHPGINANTYKNNITQDSFKQSIFSQLPAAGDGSALENYRETYTYDDSGNLINKQHTAASSSYSVDGTVNDNNNHLKEFEYDASGNQRQISINNTVTLSYNCCEKLVRACTIERPDEADDSDYYVYDSAEDRILKVNERMAQGGAVSNLSRKTYIGNYEVTQDYKVQDGNTNLTLEKRTLRIMDNQTCVAIIQYWEQDNRKLQVDKTGQHSVRFQMSNGNDSISMEMDTEARLISYEAYFPFGGTAIIAGENQVEVSLKDYRYSGKECDDSTGFYYFGARYFISWLGRWLSADPIGEKDGPNLYSYVSNNPFSYKDPDGLSKKRKAWTLADSAVEDDAGQDDLKGKSKKGRKSFYPTGTTSVSSAITQQYVTSTTGVIAILKVNGVALQTGKNGPADPTLEFPSMGTENQKGLKINPHAEDWNLNSFRVAYQESTSSTLTSFLKSEYVPSSTLNTGAVAKKPVFSLRINFSPCLGCVGTIISFKEFLDTELGVGNYILRTKFLRPYDLPKTLVDDESVKAANFIDAVTLLDKNGIKVRLQPIASAKAMAPGVKLGKTNPFGQDVIKTLFPKKYKELTKTWTQLGVNRT